METITWYNFALKLDARVGAHLTLEIRSVHFLTLGTIPDANTKEIYTGH